MHVYGSDQELAREVGNLLLEGIQTGDLLLIIATEPHRRAFAYELAAAGVNIALARLEGRFVELDAAETLAHLLNGGRIDPGAFQRVVGEVVERATESGRHVIAYGEMVELLWDSGDVIGVMDLESSWNELLDRSGITLVCGYGSRALSDMDDPESLLSVCRLHTSVHLPGDRGKDTFRHGDAPATEVASSFDPTIGAPGRARGIVVEVLRKWGHTEALVDRAAVVATELASNAVIHVGEPFSMKIRDGQSVVRISVSDNVAVPPVVRDAAPMARSGRGLKIVDSMASRWGVDSNGRGKAVWAEFDQ
jgi:hypothetical protein